MIINQREKKHMNNIELELAKIMSRLYNNINL